MSHRNVSTLAVSGLLITAFLVEAVPSSAAQPTCFGKRVTIIGNAGDEVEGTPKDDVILARTGVVTVKSFGGDDLICGRGGDEFVKAGPGADKVQGDEGMDLIFGGSGPDRLWGQGNSDSLFGGGGDDRLFGGAELQDSLIGGAGDDLIHGGAGYDMAEFWESRRAVQANLTTGMAKGRGMDELVAIEGLVGSKFDDVLTGDEHSNHLIGELGDDEIYALGSSLDGGGDILRSVGGEDLLDGGEGPDTVSYHLSPFSVEASLETGEATTQLGHDTFVGVENLTGSKYEDFIQGDGGANVIIGDWGADVLDGNGGIDLVAFYDAIGPVSASLQSGSASSPTVSTGFWEDTLSDFENIAGSAYADTLTGDDDANLLWGGSRADSLNGLGSDDVLIGFAGTDSADGGAGDDDQCDAETESNCEAESTQAIATALSSPWGDL